MQAADQNSQPQLYSLGGEGRVLRWPGSVTGSLLEVLAEGGSGRAASAMPADVSVVARGALGTRNRLICIRVTVYAEVHVLCGQGTSESTLFLVV